MRRLRGGILQRAEADRREVDPPIQVETATRSTAGQLDSLASNLRWLTGQVPTWGGPPRYTLGEQDRDRLRRILQDALIKLG